MAIRKDEVKVPTSVSTWLKGVGIEISECDFNVVPLVPGEHVKLGVTISPLTRSLFQSEILYKQDRDEMKESKKHTKKLKDIQELNPKQQQQFEATQKRSARVMSGFEEDDEEDLIGAQFDEMPAKQARRADQQRDTALLK